MWGPVLYPLPALSHVPPTTTKSKRLQQECWRFWELVYRKDAENQRQMVETAGQEAHENHICRCVDLSSSGKSERAPFVTNIKRNLSEMLRKLARHLTQRGRDIVTLQQQKSHSNHTFRLQF